MEFVPESQEQEWLIRSMGDLISERGWQQFLFQPILEPTQEYFPEASGTTFFLFDRTARRLMYYAGLDEVEVSIEPFIAGESQEPVSPVSLLGFNGRQLTVGVQTDFAPDAEDIAGTLSHVVARVFRLHHGLTHADDQEESLLVDVTTVFLGFGILSCNSSLRYRTGGEMHADWAVSAWETTQFGTLTPQAFTYLLALQARARNLDKSQLNRIRKSLETNQATFFERALALFKGKVPAIRAGLGVPEPEAWPTRRPSLFPLPELPEFSEVPVEEVEAADPVREANIKRPTFRVRQYRPWALVGGMLGALFGLASSTAFPDSLEPSIVLFSGLAFALAGALYARQTSFDVCSDPDCNCVMPAEVDDCPECGRPIKGRIRSRDHRLEAEERILEDGEIWIDD